MSTKFHPVPSQAAHAATQDAGLPEEPRLIDVLWFFYNLRHFLAIGVVVATVTAALAIKLFGRSWYRTEFYVSIDASSLPAQTERGKLLSGYNSALRSLESASIAHAIFTESAPAFSENLKASGFTRDEMMRTFTRDGGAAGRLGLEVSGLSNGIDFLIEANLPVAGLGAAGEQTLLKIVNQVGEWYNGHLERAGQEARRKSLEMAERNLRATRHLAADNSLVVQNDLVLYLTELQRLELSLRFRLKHYDDQVRDFLADNRPPSVVTTQESTLDTFLQSQRQILVASFEPNVGRVSRLVVLLQQQGALTNAEAEEVNKKLAKLREEVAAIGWSDSFLRYLAGQVSMSSHLQQVRINSMKFTDCSIECLPMLSARSSGDGATSLRELELTNWLSIGAKGATFGFVMSVLVGFVWVVARKVRAETTPTTAA